MTTEKKRPSKRAKERAKLLSESELLAAAKTTSDTKAESTSDFAADTNNAAAKTSAANKLRPEKKRG